jgi:hypothetical protein
MPKPDNSDPHSWFNSWNKQPRYPKHRLTEYLKENKKMDMINNFDEFFKKSKENMSKEDWERFVQRAQKLQNRHANSSNMVIMFEEDYENLIEMRGLFKNTNRPEYVDTLNKILGNIRASEDH